MIRSTLVRGCLVAGMALAILCGAPEEARAQYKIGDDKTFLTVGGLLQPWAALHGKEAPSGGTQTDFYVRRMRLMVSGQLNPLVNFFVSTDAPNFGRAGNYDVNMFMQDAFVELNPHRAVQIDAGMILAPFSHNGMQGAGSLLPIDYHVDMMRYPPGSNKVWRGVGVMVRGLLLKDIIEYRLAVFNGVAGNGKLVSRSTPATATTAATSWQEWTDPRNRKETPAGTISTKRVLSIGGSFDYQKNLTVTESAITPGTTGTVRQAAKVRDYYAAAADVFWDIPVGSDKIMSLNGQVNFYYYNFGDRNDPQAFYNRPDQATAARLAYTGYGFASELGYRYDMIQPFAVLDWFKSTRAKNDLGDYLAIQGGVAFYLSGHGATIKAQAGSVKADGQSARGIGMVQMQLQF
jgi:hypothetical protein